MKTIFALEGVEFDNFESDCFLVLKSHGQLITLEEFSENVILESYFDDDSSFEEEMAQDPDVFFYKIENGDDRCFGLKSMGLDVIFTQDGLRPDADEDSTSLTDQIHRNSMAWVLAPLNSPLTEGKTGTETLDFETGKLKCFEGSSGATRFVVMKDNTAVAGLEVVNNTINSLYTHSEYRHQGFASQAVNYAKTMFPELQHSISTTSDGKAFIEKFENNNDREDDKSLHVGL